MGFVFKTMFDMVKFMFKTVFAMVGVILCIVLGSTPN